MTCIVALKQDGKVYMGSDAAATTSAFDTDTLAFPKLFRKADMIIGVSGTPRIRQIVEYHADFGRFQPGDDPMQFIVCNVVEGIRAALRDHGALCMSDGLESIGGDSSFLVAFQNEFYEIESNFHVHKSTRDFAATGCGYQLAFGSLFTSRQNSNPRHRIHIALSAAAEFSAGVRAPFAIMEFDEAESHDEVAA